jgi:hypothetical protein
MSRMLQLLNRLVRALGQFIWFHLRRIFGRRPAPAAAPQSSTGSVAAVDLDEWYEELVPWPTYRSDTPAPDVLANPLYRLWSTTSLGHKWSQYFDAYQALFAARRAAPLRILEIGVYKGSSLRLWRKYFAHAGTLIVGIDTRPDCIRYDAPSEGIRVKIGSQDDGPFLAGVVAEFGPFDLIIDDGSHHSSHQIASFNHLFGPALKDSGIYVVEDLHANYWPPWRDTRNSFIDMCRELVDRMHEHYRRTKSNAHFVDRPSEQKLAAIEVPRITTMIREIRFFDSIVAIQKDRRDHVPYYLKLLK